MLSIHCSSSLKSWRNKKTRRKITKIKHFINKYKWEGINFPSEKDDWRKLEKNNVTIALNVLYTKKEKAYPSYVSKNKSNREKQDLLLVIQNEERREANIHGR